MKIDARPSIVLAFAIFSRFSWKVNIPRYIVTRMIDDMKSITREENRRRAIDTISSSSPTPIELEAALALMTEMFDERSIIVAPTRKLVMIINLKLAASTSSFGCSNETPASTSHHRL